MGMSIDGGGVTVIPKSPSKGGETVVPKTSQGVKAPELKLPEGEKQKLQEFDRVGKELQKLQQDGWDGTKPNTGSVTPPTDRPSAFQKLKDAADGLGKVGEGDCGAKVRGDLGKDKIRGEIKKPLGCPEKPLE